MRMKINRLPNGDVSLLWNAQPSTRYQVETSSDCETWDTSIQGSQVTTGEEDHVGSLTDRSAPSAGVRYYRVRQLP
ncbi:MAG: hypothetical protein R3F19_08405 [Verrucomicrobiales bacterium]